MISAYFNLDSFLGRCHAAVENGELFLSVRRGNRQTETRLPLDRMDPCFLRKRRRFAAGALKLIAVAVLIVLYLPFLLGLFSFVDEVVEFPIVEIYGYMFAFVFIAALVFGAGALLKKVVIVECRDVNGTVVANFVVTPSEEPVADALFFKMEAAILEARKTSRPSSCE